MNKYILILSLLLAAPAGAALKTFLPQETIKANDINNNFNEVKDILDQKNTSILFNNFQSGSVIYKADLESEFDKVRFLGVEVTPLSSERILAEELNTAFLQILAGVQNYDDLPVANNSTLTLDEDEIKPVVFNYSNSVGTSLIEISSAPSNGQLIANGSGFDYQSNLNYFGADSFSYRIFDGSNYSSTASVAVTINPINDVPVSTAQSLSTNEDVEKNITLSGTDIEGSVLTYEILSSPSLGFLSGTAPNLVYTPNLNIFGADSFSFRVNDGTSWSEPAVISLTVNSVNDLPTISGTQSLAVAETTTFSSSSVSGTDIESSLTYSVATAPTKGVITWGSNGAYTYTANLNAFGTDTFEIRAFDGIDYSSNLSVTVNITLPKSCKDLLAVRPSLQNQDNVYYIDLDGSGVIAPGQVSCDMTTAGGGWTNLAANIGTFNNVLNAKLVNNQNGVGSAQPLSSVGINSASVSSSAIGGSLVSRSAPGGCVGSIPKLYVTAQAMNLIKPTQAKLIAKSYGAGTYDCGGILRHSDLASGSPPLVKINPTNFATTTLARCDGAATYPASSTNVDLTFYTNFQTTDYTKDHAVAALEAICGTGTAYMQVKQLWVK